MESDETLQVQTLMAKVLMLETIQTSICTYLAEHCLSPNSFVDRVFDDAENELRVMAIARDAGMPASWHSADLALVYLGENARVIRSALAKEEMERLKQPGYERE